MTSRIKNSLLLPDLAAQYADASHSVSLRLLAYALQAFPLDGPFENYHHRCMTQNINVLRLWADMQVARGENGKASNAWKQVAVWCHETNSPTTAVSALVQAHALIQQQMPAQAAMDTAVELLQLLSQLQPSTQKSEAIIVLANSLLELGDINAAKILQQEATGDTDSLHLDASLLAAKIYLAEDLPEQAHFLLQDLEQNLSIFKDRLDARMTLGLFRLDLARNQGNFEQAHLLAVNLEKTAQDEGLLLQQAMLSAMRTKLDVEMSNDQEVIQHGIKTLKLFNQLNLGETRIIEVKAALARALGRMGHVQKGLEYSEQVASWANSRQQLAVEQEFTVIAADLAARDLQGIRAAGLYGCAADLHSEQPLLRARYLRKCAVQLVYSAGTEPGKTVSWALSLLREAGELLHGLEKTQEVSAELSAWSFDRLWVRTRYPRN